VPLTGTQAVSAQCTLALPVALAVAQTRSHSLAMRQTWAVRLAPPRPVTGTVIGTHWQCYTLAAATATSPWPTGPGPAGGPGNSDSLALAMPVAGSGDDRAFAYHCQWPAGHSGCQWQSVAGFESDSESLGPLAEYSAGFRNLYTPVIERHFKLTYGLF
jgi:hypothetical protein